VISYYRIGLATEQRLRGLGLSTTAVGVVRFRLVSVHTMMRVEKIGANTRFLDPFLSDMEAAAPLAAVDCQVITFADMTSRSVPELQGNTMFVCSSACFKEDLAAFGVGAREN
jgi:hypothetical protein